MTIYRKFGNSNPAGVFINAGYYALLGAIYGLSVEEALSKICLVPYGGDIRKRQAVRKGEKVSVDVEKLRSAMNCKCLSYRTLGELVGYSQTKIAQTVKGVKQPRVFVNELESVLGLEKNELVKGV